MRENSCKEVDIDERPKAELPKNDALALEQLKKLQSDILSTSLLPKTLKQPRFLKFSQNGQKSPNSRFQLYPQSPQQKYLIPLLKTSFFIEL